MIDSDQIWSQLIKFGNRLISETTEQSRSGGFVKLLRELLDCQPYVILLDQHIVDLDSLLGNRSDIPQKIKLLMLSAIETGETHVITDQDLETLRYSSFRYDKYQENKILTIATPIRLNDQKFGVCAIDKEGEYLFSHQEIEFLEFLVSYYAVILNTNNKLMDDRKKFDLLSLVREVSSQITQLKNLDVLSDRITRIIQKTFNYYYVAIFTIETGSEILNFRSSSGPSDTQRMDQLRKHKDIINLDTSPRVIIHLGEGIIGNVARNGIEIIANDVSNNPYYRHEDILPETKSEAAFPIIIGDKILGVLDVQSDKVNAFREEDLLVLKGLSDNIAIGLENSGLYGELQKRLTQLSSIYEVSNAITSILNFDDLLEQVIRLIQDNLGYSCVHFYTFHPINDNLVYQYGSIDHQSFLSHDFKISIDTENSTVPWVARNKKSLILNDIDEQHDYIPTAPGGKYIRSELIVPLIYGDQLLGVLEIHSDQPYKFNADDQYVVEALADNIAIALRNSNLYRSEQWRRKVADSLREVAGLLSADINLDKVLDSILFELIKTIPSMCAAIWLLDEVDDSSELGSEFRLAAVYLSTDTESNVNGLRNELDTFLGFGVDEIINHYELESSVKLWLWEGIKSDKPIIRTANTPYEPIGILLELNPDYSAIAAPLRIGDRSLGALTLLHNIPNKYGENAKLLSATFANYAAVAIENTRLYEAAHDQAWVSTVLLQVIQAMQSIDALDDLLHTIVQILPDLIGARSCAILLWDDNAASFVPGMAYGLSAQQYEEFSNWYIGEYEIPAFDKLRESKAPVVIDHADIPDNIVDLFFRSFDFSSSLYLLFPMITQNEVIGTILIDLYDEDNQSLGGVSLWDEKISIIQGVANQTAIAIENIQLIKAQEEEAYVSVALLQVAQAIVSSNNLDEILSTIVRITPILVGVRRSVIFIWDETHKIFRLSQSYGFSREEIAEMQPFYSVGEFPLLDLSNHTNKIIYYSINSPLDPFQWATLPVEDIFVAEDVHNEGEMESQKDWFIQSGYPLLIGFPLSIKENVLGIMLIEEVYQNVNVPLSRIRERRIEIITGITQQASIAIQNDILNRNVLERERLEREMQLAREIQSAFLPEKLPAVVGWDLDVRWRPARQVGGDFYDIFELPFDHLGIVIADVADKGMPAALYMTLVRTLIRAAVQDQNSPREVLNRVNNLLVPDSRQGMFVTLVYTVLSLKTGQVIYANAGHNPPISINTSSGEISEHMRSAMALGVFSDIDINENRITLNQGDYLILYTDGITEAFSNTDELFGLDRLKEIFRNSEYVSAASLLDQIESAVTEFSEGQSQSDDITLVAIHRRK